MSYQREEYQEYLNANGIYNTSPYSSCLDKIEKTVHVDIDWEYDTDKCEGLLKTLLELRGNAADDAKKYGQYKNLMSKLNKYCQFRGAPDQPVVAEMVVKEEIPIATPQVRHIPDESEEEFFFNANEMTVPMEVYIRQCRSFDEFEEKYLDQFVANDDRVGQYLQKLLWKYDKDQATVSTDAGLNRSYVGNIVRGRNNNPSRDVLIAICLATGTTVDEVQHLLRYSGHNPLYVRRKRDVIIWFGFMKHWDVTRVNEDLDTHECPLLIPKDEDAADSST